MSKLKGVYNNILNKGSERTVKVKKNIAMLTVFKGLSIAISLILVPMTLDYVDSGTYGIWLTLSSVVGWISFFDIGINNGLKNRLTEALAKNDIELGRTYVSTTYAMLSMIFIPLMIVIVLAAPYIDWASFLNIEASENRGLVAAICIIVTYFCLNFILSTINIVMLAHQAPAEASFRSLVQQVFSLAAIYLLTVLTRGNLVNLCLGLCLSPLLVIALFNISLFKGKYYSLRPSLKYVDFHKLPDLLRLGAKFFIIQIAGIIQFQLVNILIMRNYGADEVTSYNIAYKYFNVLYMIWGIMMTPIWAAVTDAAAREEYGWIKNMQRKYLFVFGMLSLAGFFMLVVSHWVYDMWVGDKVSISFMLSLWVLIYNIVLMFGSIYVQILNGLGRLNLQTIACCVSPLVFLGVTWVLVDRGVGVYAILIASVIANFNGFILAPIQCYSFLSKAIRTNRQMEEIYSR